MWFLKFRHIFEKKFFLIAMAGPGAMLLVAFFMEHVLRLQPCRFCFYERWVYVSIIACGLLWFCLQKRWSRLSGVIAIMVCLLCGIGVTTVHVGIERGFVDEKLCAVEAISYDDMLKSLEDLDDGDERLPSCAKVELRILGLSLAEWNLIVMLVYFLVCFDIAVRLRRKD